MTRLLALALICVVNAAAAGPGHDHGPDTAPGATAATAAPRFGTHSTTFELVGVLEAQTLVLYLDRYTTNEPVTDARIEIEGEALKGIATPVADGTYRIAAAGLAAPGTHLMTFTVTAGTEADLLDASLAVNAPAAPAHAATGNRLLWIAAAAGGLVLAVALLMLARRKVNP